MLDVENNNGEYLNIFIPFGINIFIIWKKFEYILLNNEWIII